MKKIVLTLMVILCVASALYADDQPQLRSGKFEIGAGVRFLVNPSLSLAWFPSDHFSVSIGSSINASGSAALLNIPGFMTANFENTFYFLKGNITPIVGINAQAEFKNGFVDIVSILPKIGVDLQTDTPFFAQASWEPFPIFTVRPTTRAFLIQGAVNFLVGIRI